MDIKEFTTPEYDEIKAKLNQARSDVQYLSATLESLPSHEKENKKEVRAKLKIARAVYDTLQEEIKSLPQPKYSAQSLLSNILEHLQEISDIKKIRAGHAKAYLEGGYRGIAWNLDNIVKQEVIAETAAQMLGSFANLPPGEQNLMGILAVVQNARAEALKDVLMDTDDNCSTNPATNVIDQFIRSAKKDIYNGRGVTDNFYIGFATYALENDSIVFD